MTRVLAKCMSRESDPMIFYVLILWNVLVMDENPTDIMNCLEWKKKKKQCDIFHVDLHVDNRLTFVQANNRKMQNNYKIIIKKQGHFDTVQHHLY